MVAPFVTAPGNANETKLFPDAFNKLKDIAKAVGMNIVGAVISLDGAYDSKKNRKMIFNAGMVPNINENKRNRKSVRHESAQPLVAESATGKAQPSAFRT